jgi:hypothetical protein
MSCKVSIADDEPREYYYANHLAAIFHLPRSLFCKRNSVGEMFLDVPLHQIMSRKYQLIDFILLIKLHRLTHVAWADAKGFLEGRGEVIAVAETTGKGNLDGRDVVGKRQRLAH